MLEAAVVLEAWAGVPAASALAAARELTPDSPRAPQPSVGRLPAPSAHRDGVVPGAAFIVTVIAIACWAEPLASSLGGRVVERGLMLALPLTLALQWGLQSRYLNHPQGVAQLAGRRRRLLVGAAALVAVPAGFLGAAGVLAGLLAVTWTGGTLLVGCRRPLPSAAIVLGTTPAMVAGLRVMTVLAAVAVATTVAVALALRARAVPARPTPGRWPRAVAAGAIGAGLGLMLVLDRTVAFSEGAVPALALSP
jgi:MFS family permease